MSRISLYDARSLPVEELVASSSSIADFPRTRYEAAVKSLIVAEGDAVVMRHGAIGELSDAALYAAVHGSDAALYAAVHGSAAERYLTASFDELEASSDDTIMDTRGPLRIEGFDRDAYANAYEQWLPTLDEDTRPAFEEAATIDDFSLYSTVRINGVPMIAAAPSL